jgi:opacity protein-like surface antigen
MGRSVLVLAGLLALGSSAQADGQPAPLPSLALDPQAPPPSIWKGLYVGSDLFVGGVKGSKAVVGGGGYMGYDRHFDNNLVLGVQAAVGYAPWWILPGPFKGYDYGLVSAKLGYEMGRFTPYVTTGIALAKPDGGPGGGYLSPADSANALFNGSPNLATSGVFGAGFNYALTSNTTVGLAAVVGAGHGLIAPPP